MNVAEAISQVRQMHVLVCCSCVVLGAVWGLVVLELVIVVGGVSFLFGDVVFVCFAAVGVANVGDTVVVVVGSDRGFHFGFSDGYCAGG